MEKYWEKKMSEERFMRNSWKAVKNNSMIDSKPQVEPDRLSTIEEKRSLEEEVNIKIFWFFPIYLYPGKCVGGGDFSTKDQNQRYGKNSLWWD